MKDQPDGRDFSAEMSAYIRKNFVIIFGYCGYALLAASIGFYFYAASEHRAVLKKNEINRDEITELKNQWRTAQTYQILSEKRLSEIANKMEIENRNELATTMRTLVKELETIRSQKK